MIEFKNVRKVYKLGGIEKVVLNNLNLQFPENRNVAILGHNGAGKSTLMRLIAGAEAPTAGRIIRHTKVSWPLGFGGGFGPEMTGIENARFVARIYGEDTAKIIDYVMDFSELGPSIKLPIRTYSSGMRARLAFGLSMAINFGYYLVDEITAVGDARFKKKCEKVFQEKLENANIVMISHSEGTLKKFCDCAYILDKGNFEYFEHVQDAINKHNENQAR